MNTKDAIKYLAIAVGAYLLYQWLSKNGYLAQLGIGTSTAAGTAAAATAGATVVATDDSGNTIFKDNTTGAMAVVSAAVLKTVATGPSTPIPVSVAANGNVTIVDGAGKTVVLSGSPYVPGSGAAPTGTLTPTVIPTPAGKVPTTSTGLVQTAPVTTGTPAPARTQIATIPSASGDGSYIPVYSDGTMGAPVFPGASGGGTPAPVSPSQSTVALVAAMSQGDSYLNGGGTNGSGPFDHWNYYYNQTAEGKANPGPNDSDVGVDPNANITLQQWWNLVSAHGVSGLRGLSGYAPGFTQWGIG